MFLPPLGEFIDLVSHDQSARHHLRSSERMGILDIGSSLVTRNPTFLATCDRNDDGDFIPAAHVQ